MYDHFPEPVPDGLSLDDAALTLDELDARYTCFDRWPEWRLLYQTRIWVNGEREAVAIDGLSDHDQAALRTYLRSYAPLLHGQAAEDEGYALSSAMRWAYVVLGVPLVTELHPLVWLDSTPLMRDLDARCDKRWPAVDPDTFNAELGDQ